MSKLAAGLVLSGLFSAITAIPQSHRASDSSIPIPADRLDDSYKIYAGLLPNGEMSLPGWPHALWLVQSVTVSIVPDGQPCAPGSSQDPMAGSGMNPHTAVYPPREWQQDFKEILDDFDRHCHDRLQLRSDMWKLPSPVLLLTADEQKVARETQFGTRGDSGAKYKGASAIFGFSEIYFNAHHTVALVYLTDWCGSLCAHGAWLALALENGSWKPLRWHAATWIS